MSCHKHLPVTSRACEVWRVTSPCTTGTAEEEAMSDDSNGGSAKLGRESAMPEMDKAGAAHAAALRYAERGWSVVPLLPGSKRPAVMWSAHQYTRATTEQIDDWWNQ